MGGLEGAGGWVLRVLKGYTQSHAPTAAVILDRLGVFVKGLRVTLVELSATVDGGLDGCLAKDVHSLFRFPASGVPLLEAVCRREGYEDIVTINPQDNCVPGRLDVGEWKRLADTDVLGLSVLTRMANQSFELARRIANNILTMFPRGAAHSPIIRNVWTAIDSQRRTDMPHTATINTVSGVYTSDCCGIERTVAENDKFPPCPGGKLGCGGTNANWTLVRKTQTK